jgi:protease I
MRDNAVTKSGLKGRRIAALVADGYEKVELALPMRALQLVGAKVDVISLRRGRIRGVNLHEPASRVHVTKTVHEANPADYDGLLLPGGFISPDLLRQSSQARAFVSAFDAAGKPIATLCHGPWVLASAGLLNGRTVTSWPGIRDDVVNAGATWLDQELVRDGNLLTSRGPQDLAAFIPAIKRLFGGEQEPSTAKVPQAGPSGAQSSPQASEPPRLMLNVMRWTPRPSFRTAIALALLAFGISKMNRAGVLPNTLPKWRRLQPGGLRSLLSAR